MKTCYQCVPPVHCPAAADWASHLATVHGVASSPAGARYTSALIQAANQGDRAAALFRISAEASGFCVFVVVLEHPVLGGAGHPLAQLLSGRDALERGLELFDRCVAAVTQEQS